MATMRVPKAFVARCALNRSSPRIACPLLIPSTCSSNRSIHASPALSEEASSSTSDWSAEQYLKFASERARPALDLLSRLPPNFNPKRVFDLGCGPATTTKLLVERFPNAKVIGVDSSPAMVEAAREALPSATFEEGDLKTWELPDAEEESSAPDLIFANAVLHWLRERERQATLGNLEKALRPGSVLALQVPHNYHESTHRLMREIANNEGPWQQTFEEAQQAGVNPALDKILPPMSFYDLLMREKGWARIDVWTTTYMHPLDSAAEIVEWVKGTGLRPFMDVLKDEPEVQEHYLKKYEQTLERAYPKRPGGKVLLKYPRLFVVAVKK